MRGRALRRALETTDAVRLNASVPLITDTTELITPTVAQEILQRNRSNRPVNWQRVESYASSMLRGEWQLTAQGLILDEEGCLLTGQNRLWAVVYSGTSVYMRVSRGNPRSAGPILDRGMPQSSRDLATRTTGRKHSPTEASLARAALAMEGMVRPSADCIAGRISILGDRSSALLRATSGTRKTKAVLMILGAIAQLAQSVEMALRVAPQVELLAGRLEKALEPQCSANQCWGRGAAFSLAMEQARRLVLGSLTQ